MRLYTKQHKPYCGIYLHTKKMQLCIRNQEDERSNIPTYSSYDRPPRHYAVECTTHQYLVFLDCLHASKAERRQLERRARPHY